MFLVRQKADSTHGTFNFDIPVRELGHSTHGTKLTSFTSLTNPVPSVQTGYQKVLIGTSKQLLIWR